jgi:glycerol-3-phosphate dehydrogenase (NAD(P)+)
MFARDGGEVLIWTSNAEKRASINERHRSLAVPTLKLPEGIRAVETVEEALESRLVVLAIQPSWIRILLRKHSAAFRPEHRVIHAVKGFEAGGSTISQVVEQETCVLRTGALGGPVVPRELWGGGYNAAVIGSAHQAVIDDVSAKLIGEHLRVYGTRDRLGVEIGGAMRTPVALAAGMIGAGGRRPALTAVMLTRAIAEAARLAAALGGDGVTLSGLSGIGDWMVTCHDPDDPLMQAGRRLALGVPLAYGEAEARVRTLLSLAADVGVDMPITESVGAVLDGASVAEALAGAMARDSRPEAG